MQKGTPPSPPLFQEEQAFRQWWVWALIIGLPAVNIGAFGYGIYQQIIRGQPWGDEPMPDALLLAFAAIMTALSIALVVLFLTMRLITQVHADGVYIRYFPFHRSLQRFPFDEIASHEAVKYNPILEYGGWGIRYGWKGKAYNVSGNRGVRLKMTNGQSLLIGSQKPDEMAMAMRSMMARR